MNHELLIIKWFKEVFSKKKYISIAVLTASFVLFFILWLPNLALLRIVVFDYNIGILDKAKFLLLSPLMFASSFTSISAIITILISFLFGANIAILAYNFNFRYGGVSIGGIISGLFGVGCVSCGSVLLPILGLSSAALILPLRGQEFSILAMALLSFSLYSTSKKISQKTCVRG